MIVQQQDRRDIVVIGGAAGGRRAVTQLLSEVPVDLPAAVFLVLHLSSQPSDLVAELAGEIDLPVQWAVDGAAIEPGRVLVAPPDHHLMLLPRGVALGRGPREHRSRPSVDVLFRTAARSFGPRVLGVVLSGALHDGTGGAMAIDRHGGLMLAQDPLEAEASGMPAGVVTRDAPAIVAPVSTLAKHLVELVGEPVPTAGRAEVDVGIDLDEPPTGHTCPECGGALWEEDLPILRCRVGHAFAPEDLIAEAAMKAEAAMWTAIRSLSEEADLGVRLGERARGAGDSALGDRYDERTDAAREAVVLLHELLRRGLPGTTVPVADDAVAADREVLASAADRIRQRESGRTSGLPVDLTPREREVLSLLAGGMATKDMARLLGIRHETCRGYIKSLLVKLDARSQLQAVVIAASCGLLDDGVLGKSEP